MPFRVVVTRPIDLFGFTLAVDDEGKKFCMPAKILDHPVERNSINLSRELRRKSIFNNETVGFVSLFPGFNNKVIVFDTTTQTVTKEIVRIEPEWDHYSLQNACKIEARFAKFITSLLKTRKQKLITSNVGNKSDTLVYSSRGEHTFITGFTERYTDYHNFCNFLNIFLDGKITTGRINIKNAIEVEKIKDSVTFSVDKYTKIFGTRPQDRQHGYH